MPTPDGWAYFSRRDDEYVPTYPFRERWPPHGASLPPSGRRELTHAESMEIEGLLGGWFSHPPTTRSGQHIQVQRPFRCVVAVEGPSLALDG